MIDRSGSICDGRALLSGGRPCSATKSHSIVSGSRRSEVGCTSVSRRSSYGLLRSIPMRRKCGRYFGEAEFEIRHHGDVGIRVSNIPIRDNDGLEEPQKRGAAGGTQMSDNGRRVADAQSSSRSTGQRSAIRCGYAGSADPGHPSTTQA